MKFADSICSIELRTHISELHKSQRLSVGLIGKV